MGQQLALNIQLRDDATFESFYPGDNQEALAAVNSLSRFQEFTGSQASLTGSASLAGSLFTSEHFIYLWGAEGVGKSHLLQAACHQAQNLGFSTIYLPFSETQFSSEFIKGLEISEFIQGLENIDLICLDDIDISLNPSLEESLFHLFNRIRAQNTRLLIASKSSPKNIQIQLPDLKSRLSWGITYQLHPLKDEQKCEALALRAEARGLLLNKTVAQFLLNHCPRTMSELFHTLELLDKASLQEQRRLTIPFVKQILGV